MEQGYGGGHPYSAPVGQFPMPSLQQFPAQAAAPLIYPPAPPPPPLQYPGSYPSIPYPHFAPPAVPLQPVPQAFFNPWEPPPPIMPPPADPELHKRIDKLVEYAAKNGPEFEKMLKEKQKENPAYAFLFGAEGYGYYRYKLWITVNPPLGGFMGPVAAPLPHLNPALSPLNPALAPLSHTVSPSLNPAFNASLTPPLHSGPSPPVLSHYYDQQQQPHHQLPQSQPYFEPTYPESGFKGLSGPLPTDVAVELQGVLENLTGTKESIKGAKNWFMQRSPFAPALAEALRERVLALDDDVRQLHIIYLANDILFDSLQRRINLKELDNEALAFQRVLGSMLAAIYHNPQNRETNQTRLQKILQFWGSKEVYSQEAIAALESEMIAGPPAGYRVSAPVALPNIERASSFPTASSAATSLPVEPPTATENVMMPSPETSVPAHSSPSKEHPSVVALAGATQHGSAASGVAPSTAQVIPSAVFSTLNPSLLSTLGNPTLPISQPALAQMPSMHADAPPYPLFPPGLIPGMVRKMQIGSGVPYSPLSPLDIPAVIPPSTVSDTYILDRVAKFFKEIGEADPLEGKFKSAYTSQDDEDEEEREQSRTGGACIPPPSSLQVDAESNTLPDGSMELKPGAITSGRLGLGAVADPNEITQYDDVYTSYRKQRSTSYHTFMSARAAAR